MERSSLGSQQVDEEADFNLKEWGLRARRISRENTTISRRFSASNLKSFREEARSFPSNVTVSSTASSPGYTAREEIDPSTYSFTTALRALQAKTVYTWELQARDAGLILNSKWNEAEKYISNPLSGQVPLECLSAKTLSGRSFRGLTTRITMSAPLIYPSHLHHFHPNPPIKEHESHIITSNAEKKETNKERGTTRDVGTQSTPVEVSSSSPTPAPTPSIQERSINMADSSVSFKSLDTTDTEVETNETREREISIKINGGERKQESRGGGCLSLWMRRRTQTHKEKHKTTTDNSNRLSTFLHHFNGCSSKE